MRTDAEVTTSGITPGKTPVARLFLMMFLQIFIWGAWLPLIFGYLPTLGFTPFEQSWILNAFPIAAIIGLFHGMFEEAILTFNPGLTVQGPLETFEDIREIRARLIDAGVQLSEDLDPDETGPAHIRLIDPDGNAILVDQFFPKPGEARA